LIPIFWYYFYKFNLDKAEEKKKEELRNQAAKELQQWNAQRKEGLELRKRQNRLLFKYNYSSFI
jgi:hypothetical protein